MDIAKIRKKLAKAEADDQRSKENNQAARRQEEQETKPDEKNITQGPLPVIDLHKETTGHPPKAEAPVEQKSGSSGKYEDKSNEKEAKTYGVESRISAEKTEDVVEILTFTLLREDFAFKVSQLDEILRYQWITKVPNVPQYVLGVTSLRGKVIPVLDLKLKLSLTDKPLDNNLKGKILIIKGTKGPIGVTVDKVAGVVRLTKSEILPPPSHLSETELKFIEGIAVVDKHFVSIINMEEATSLQLK
jgi:purine-binding chemotaxis protein CheW